MSLLQVEGLTRHFGGLRAVEDVSLEVDERRLPRHHRTQRRGQDDAVLAARRRSCRRRPGRVVFDGQDITGWPAHRVAHAGLVRTFQLMRPFGSMSVLDNVTIASHTPTTAHARRRAAHALEVLERVRLDDARRRDTGSLTTAGLKRLELARALAMRAAGAAARRGAGRAGPRRAAADDRDLLRELHGDGLTVLYVEHIMAAVMALSQRLLVMHEGRSLALGDPQEVVQDPRVVEAYLGEEPALMTLELRGRARRLRPDGDPPRRLACAWTPGEIVSLIGANGAGKTTTLRAIAGIVAAPRARSTSTGDDVANAATRPRRHAAALVHVAQDRELFGDLTVPDNLVMGGYTRPRPERSRWTRRGLRAVPGRCRSAHASGPTRCRAASSRCSPSGGR